MYCRILGKKLNVPWRKLRNLSDLQNELQTNLEDIIEKVDKLLPQKIYTRDDVIRELDITSDELNADILTPNTVHLEQFKLRQRALHVFEGMVNIYSSYATNTCLSRSGRYQVQFRCQMQY